MISIDAVLEKKGSLNIAQYVSNVNNNAEKLSIEDALTNWNESSSQLKNSMNELFQILN